MYSFKNDYSEIAHPRIVQALAAIGAGQDEGYGNDRICTAARELIRKHLGPEGREADIHFLCGGTQTNLTTIAAFLRPHEALIAADTSHVYVNETGAIELTGHKIIPVAGQAGKLSPEAVRECLTQFHNEHTVKPRLVKISQTTERGTLYTLEELEALSVLCKEHDLFLYVDGARLGSALVAEGATVTLADLCRLTDAFYIGGTKNGAMLGEAVVLNNNAVKDFFRYAMKQRGALLAKGRVLGVQFEELFKDTLYFDLARHANAMAQKMVFALKEAGFQFLVDSPSNQIFPVLPQCLIDQLAKKWDFYTWQRLDETRSAIRLVTSWATREEAVDAFIFECTCG